LSVGEKSRTCVAEEKLVGVAAKCSISAKVAADSALGAAIAATNEMMRAT
jgi:hypothetical protein